MYKRQRLARGAVKTAAVVQIEDDIHVGFGDQGQMCIRDRSKALDCVERELLGVTSNHGKRVACVSMRLCRDVYKRQGDDKLREALNKAIVHIRLNGEYDRITRKYFAFSIY